MPNGGPDLEYSGRIIHFGANLKSVEEDWGEWKQKFEALLKKLYWQEANVHFNTEYTTLQTFSWRVDLLKYDFGDKTKMPPAITEAHWQFTGPEW